MKIHELEYKIHHFYKSRGIPTDLAPDANSRAQCFYSNFGGFIVRDFTCKCTSGLTAT